MAQRTQQVEYRLFTGESVSNAGRTHCDVIAPLVAAEVEVLSEETVAEVISALCAALDTASGVLKAAEDRHVAELGDDFIARDARDDARPRLETLFRRLRRRVEDALGESGLKRYGLEAPVPGGAVVLASRVESTINLLREDPTDLDDGLGVVVPTTTIADSLAAALAPFAEAVDALGVEEREAEGTMTDRDRAIVAWMVVYRGVATILSGLFLLAGREDLAERVRPTDRRADGAEGPPSEPAAPVAGPTPTPTPTDGEPTGPAPTDPTPTGGGPTGPGSV